MSVLWWWHNIWKTLYVKSWNFFWLTLGIISGQCQPNFACIFTIRPKLFLPRGIVQGDRGGSENSVPLAVLLPSWKSWCPELNSWSQLKIFHGNPKVAALYFSAVLKTSAQSRAVHAWPHARTHNEKVAIHKALSQLALDLVRVPRWGFFL